MTCFSPFDRKPLYESLAREARILALGCADGRMRISLQLIAESWDCLAQLHDDLDRTILPESMVRGRSANRQALRARYATAPAGISISWQNRP